MSRIDGWHDDWTGPHPAVEGRAADANTSLSPRGETDNSQALSRGTRYQRCRLALRPCPLHSDARLGTCTMSKGKDIPKSRI